MSSHFRVRTAVILAVIIVLTALIATIVLRKTVSLTIDGKAQRLTTYALTVGRLLHEQGITHSQVDQLSPAQDTWLKNGDQVTLQHAIPIQVFSAGELITIFSSERTPSRLIIEAGLSLQPSDQVLSNGRIIDPGQAFPAEIQSISLQVIPSVTFAFNDKGDSRSLSSSLPTLGSALWAAGINLYSSDRLDPPPGTSLSPGLSAKLLRSKPVVIQTKDITLTIRTTAETVGEALVDAHLPLEGLDYSIPPADALLPPGLPVKVVHVVEDVLIEQSPLPFETEYQPAAETPLDSQTILQAGEYGLNAQRLRVRYEDGVEKYRQVEGQWIARQPVTRIIGYGTLVTMQTETVDGVQIQYWRKLDMYATSYHPSEVGNTTASGLPLQKGVAAIDLNYVPFYTQMYVPGYGEVIAADIGGGVIGRWIDLGYSDSDYVPWHQWVTVYFLWPPPANIVWVVP